MASTSAISPETVRRFLFALGLLSLAPPWIAEFHPAPRGSTADRYELRLDWPWPTFWSPTPGTLDQKRFGPFVAIWNPPRPSTDVAALSSRPLGFWTTRVDWSRLAALALGGTILVELLQAVWLNARRWRAAR